jgi:hypothetical protein
VAYLGDTVLAPSAGTGEVPVHTPGYRLVAGDGGIFDYGATFHGSLGGTTIPSPIVGVADEPDSGGYWMVSAAGTVYYFDAPILGNLSTPPTDPIVGIASTINGGGYWLVGRDGDVHSFGNAADFVGTGAGAAHVVAVVSTDGGGGIWLALSNGVVQVYGEGATFYGDLPGDHVTVDNIVGMTTTPLDNGYWLVGSDGGIFAFGAARFKGSMGGKHLNKPIVGMGVDPATGGYWMVASDGGMFSFGAPFLGSTGGMHINSPILAMSVG